VQKRVAGFDRRDKIATGQQQSLPKRFVRASGTRN
jgi:hypothetical protein